MVKKKICFVVQRYGLEVNGGAELHCRQIAERLTKYFEVEVLTTCALEYYTWKDFYSPGKEVLNGVKVRRFRVDCPRDMKKFDKKAEYVFNNSHSLKDEEEWMKLQGPLSSELLDYINENKDVYKAFIFFTYLYALTYYGLPLVKEKAFLVPTAHDEPPIYLSIFKKVFSLPHGIIYNSLIEKEFIEGLFKNESIINRVVGVGFDKGISHPANFRKKYNIWGDFILYVGRIEESKNCKQLLDYFIKYKNNNKNQLKLVLIGGNQMKLTLHEDILFLGKLSDEDKFNAISASKLLINPSIYESLSMVVLESMIEGVPVIVNEKCGVTKEHCIKSNAGLWYNNYGDFEKCINFILKNPTISKKMGENGERYVLKNYSWNWVLENYLYLIEFMK